MYPNAMYRQLFMEVSLKPFMSHVDESKPRILIKSLCTNGCDDTSSYNTKILDQKLKKLTVST